MVNLGWLIMWFEVISRLRIKLDKRELLPMGRVENLQDLSLEYGCKVGALPSSYLGLPLGALFKSMTAWKGIEEKICKRLACGKNNIFLNKGELL